MSFSLPKAGAYSRIPDNPRKAATSFDDVLEKWDARDEIKYQKPAPGKTGFYYSDSQQPEGFLKSGQRFLAHLVNPQAQEAHRQGIAAVLNELKQRSTSADKKEARSEAALVEQAFQARKFFGQPLSVGALKASLDEASKRSSAIGKTFSLPFNIFRTPRKRKEQQPPLFQSSRPTSSTSKSGSSKFSYQLIVDDDEPSEADTPFGAYYQSEESESLPLQPSDFKTLSSPHQNTTRQEEIRPQASEQTSSKNKSSSRRRG